MIIERHPNFKKSFKKRISQHPKLVKQTTQRLKMFEINHLNPILRDHKLISSKKGLRSFSVTGDLRIIYKKVSEDRIILLDIGIHNQVY